MIDNWPPDQPDVSVSDPPGLVAMIAEAERKLEDLRRELREARQRMAGRRTLAWIAYHDRHGWPDDPGYRARMMHEARLIGMRGDK